MAVQMSTERGRLRRPTTQVERAIHTYHMAREQLTRAVNRSGQLRDWSGLRNGDMQDAYALTGLLLQATRVSLVLEAWVGGVPIHEADQAVPPVAP